MSRKDIEDAPTRSSDIIIGGLLTEVERQEKRIAALENKTAQINELILWNKIFKWIFFAVSAFVVGVFWRHPELWTKLVGLLK
jgi:hypothetical protein